MALETAVIIAIVSLASTAFLGLVGVLSKVKSSRCGACECERGAADANEILEQVVNRQEQIIEDMSRTQELKMIAEQSKLNGKKTIDEVIDDNISLHTI